MIEELEIESVEDENILEEIRHETKKPKLSLLNQKKVSKWEMDELFLDEEYEEEM